jgi:hypothetical protein
VHRHLDPRSIRTGKSSSVRAGIGVLGLQVGVILDSNDFNRRNRLRGFYLDRAVSPLGLCIAGGERDGMMPNQRSKRGRPMVDTHKPITVTKEDDLADLLDRAAAEPIYVEKDGVVYRVSRADGVEDIWAGYDPERVRAGLRAMSGIITAEEATRLKDLVYRGREESMVSLDQQ